MIKHETSYGIIPLRYIQGHWETLLVLHTKGHWAFPKGHAEGKEDGKMTARRELKEETGLALLRFFDRPPIWEQYFFQDGGDLVHKTAIYWLAEVTGESVIQLDEIAECRWVSLNEASLLATFPKTKEICQSLDKRMNELT